MGMPEDDQAGLPGAHLTSVLEGETQAVPEGSQTARKRVRTENLGEERPKKRVKLKISDSVIITSYIEVEKLKDEVKGTPKKRGRPPKVKIECQSNKSKETLTKKGEGKASKGKANDLVSIPISKWRVAHALPTSVSTTSGNIPESTQKPRIWFSSRDELLSTLPELAGSKCFNGLSWELYETPILLLDETNAAFQATYHDADPRYIDLVTTRVFVRSAIPKKKQDLLPKANSSVHLTGMEPHNSEIYHPPTMKPVIKFGKLKFKKNADTTPIRAETIPALAQIDPYAQPPAIVPQMKQNILPEVNIGALTEYLSQMEPGLYRLSPEPPDSPINETSSEPVRIDFFSAPLPTYNAFNKNVRSPVLPHVQHVPHQTINAEIDTSSQTSLFFGPLQHSGDILHADLPGNYVEVYNSRLATPMTYNPPNNFDSQVQQYPQYFSKESRKSLEESNAHSHPKQKNQTDHRHHQSTQNESTQNDFSQPKGNVNAVTGLNLDDLGYVTNHLMPGSVSAAKVSANHGRRASKGSPSTNHPNFHQYDDDKLPTLEPVEPVFMGVVGRQVQDINRPLEGPQDDPEFVAAQDPTQSLGTRQEDGVVLTALPQQPNQPARNAQEKLLNTLPHEPTQPLETPQPHGDFIPTPLPQEIQTIIDAYLFGRPLTLIASHGHLLSRWSMHLPMGIRYAMMGYFKIIGVQETRLDQPAPADQANGLQSLSDQVQWLFRLQWRPGGEEFIMPKSDPQTLEHPWWAPMPDTKNTEETADVLEQEAELTSNAKDTTPDPAETADVPGQEAESTSNVTDTASDPEDAFPTTDKYRQARLSHPEYVFRHDHYRLLYECLLPTSLLAAFGPFVLDSAFPRGWFCEDCGRVNYQTALRHRKCASPSCKDKPPSAEPYALELLAMRDPQDRLPISLPYNTCPSWVETKVLMHQDGIQTISYLLNKNGTSCIAHIFTGNVENLQDFATILLEQIQLQVELKRPLNDKSPYFSYSAKSPKEIENPTENPWPNLPNCMNDAKATLYSRARTFSGLQDTRVSINHLTLLAWIASGTRKGPEILRAKEKCVVITSFGCEVVLTLLPRSMEMPTVQKVFSNTQPCGPADEPSEHVITADSIIIQKEAMELPQIAPPIKAEKPSFELVLVHGDCIVLDGDDFEYSIKRDGTSFPLHLVSLDCISRKNIVVQSF